MAIYVDNFINAWKLFSKRKGVTLAAASSFFALLSLVPLTLLTVRLLGAILGDAHNIQSEFFSLIEEFFPNVDPKIYQRVESLLLGPLKAQASVTFINTVILFISSSSFINSIWNALYLITEDRSFLNLWKHLRGLVVLCVTIFLVAFLYLLPPALQFIAGFVKNNTLTNYLWENIEGLREVISFLFKIQEGAFFLLESSFFHNIILIAYFTFLYRWIFSKRITIKNAFVAALFFVFSLIVGKKLFWVYFLLVKKGLMRNYGEFYTVVMALLWPFVALCFFYFGACLCYIWRSRARKASRT